MQRSICWIALACSLAAGRAEAIELFTNFRNGENLGLPPMEVPISMYSGFGRGGWAPGVEGAPLKTNPPVPAMLPTGPSPMHHGPAYGSFGGDVPVAPGCQSYGTVGTGWHAAGNVAFRRHGRRHRGGLYGGFSPPPLSAIEGTQINGPANEPSVDVAPTPAVPREATIIHVEPGLEPVGEPMLDDARSSGSDSDNTPPEPPATIRGGSDLWPQADALFPRNDAG